MLRTRIPEDRRKEWIERALRLVDDFPPQLDPGDVRTWPVWKVLRPHAAVVVRYADEARIAQPTSRLMNELEQYLNAKGLYDEAEPLTRRAVTDKFALNAQHGGWMRAQSDATLKLLAGLYQGKIDLSALRS